MERLGKKGQTRRVGDEGLAGRRWTGACHLLPAGKRKRTRLCLGTYSAHLGLACSGISPGQMDGGERPGANGQGANGQGAKGQRAKSRVAKGWGQRGPGKGARGEGLGA